DLRCSRRRLDVEEPGLNNLHRAKRTVGVASVDRRRPPISYTDRYLDRMMRIAALDQRNHRTEYLFLRNPHFGVDSGQGGRFDKKAMFEIALFHPLAAA